jgi:leader peptidase (prepilin peptidase)/N-methyltransferase
VLIALLCGAAGLLVGSFLTMLIARVPPRRPLLQPGPSCPSCDRRLGLTELVPVASWLWLRRRCRGCAAPISVRNPVVELTTGLLFAVTAWRLGPTPELAAVLAFVAGGVALAAIDLEHHRLPTPLVRVTLGLVAVGLIIAALAQGTVQPLLTAAVGAAIFCGMLLVAHLVSPRSMGFGDVRLAVVLGAVLGWYSLGLVIWGMLLGHLLGALAGLIVGLARRRVRGVKIAFGPPLIASALLVVLLAGPSVAAQRTDAARPAAPMRALVP